MNTLAKLGIKRSEHVKTENMRPAVHYVPSRYERIEQPNGSCGIVLEAPRLVAVGLIDGEYCTLVLIPGDRPMKTLVGREARAVLDVLDVLYG